MSTRNQRAANREKAPNSPVPAAGAGPSSHYNAARHGIFAIHQIMFDEAAGDLAELAAEYQEQYSPANPNERFLVDTLIHNEWRLRRMRRVEAELWDLATKFFLQENSGASACSSGEAFARGESTFERLQQIVNSCQRIYQRTHKEMERVQAQRSPGRPDVQPEAAAPTGSQAPAEPLQPQQSKTTSATSASFRQNAQAPEPAAAEPPSTPPLVSQAPEPNSSETARAGNGESV